MVNKSNFKEVVYSLVKDEYTFLDDYIDTKTKIRVRHNCKDCNNYEYKVTPNKFLQGQRCPYCADLKRKASKQITHEQYKEKVFNMVGNEYTVLDDFQYSGDMGKIKFRHNCEYCGNHEYESTPNYFQQGKRCRICSGSKIDKFSFRNDFEKKFKDQGFILVSDYTGYKNPITIKHIKCNKTFELSPNHVRQPRTDTLICPHCGDRRWHGEATITDKLTEMGINFKRQITFDECKYRKNLYFDFQVFYDKNNPKKFMLIEYDGVQHYTDIADRRFSEGLEIRQIRDNIKTNFCLENDIPLLRIRKSQLKNFESIYKKKIEQIKNR